MATRWGIASVGKISHDFVTAMGSLPVGEHTVVAVAARDLLRAQSFANLHGAHKAYGSYQDLANDSEIEVVYIGTVNSQHLGVAKLMLNNGKHVLCEKPLTMNLKQSTELINLAKEKGLFLMEGIWSRNFPIYDWIKEEINSGSLGDIKQVIVSHGLQLTNEYSFKQKTLGGGTVLNLGVYPIQLVSLVYNGEKPILIQAAGHLDPKGIDNSISATLLYENGCTATIITHCLVQLPNEAIIVGTKGTIRVPNFWCPTMIYMPSGEVKTLALPQSVIPYNFINSAALRFEAVEVRKCLQAGLKESPRIPHQESLLIAEIEDEIRRQNAGEYANLCGVNKESKCDHVPPPPSYSIMLPPRIEEIPCIIPPQRPVCRPSKPCSVPIFPGPCCPCPLPRPPAPRYQPPPPPKPSCCPPCSPLPCYPKPYC